MAITYNQSDIGDNTLRSTKAKTLESCSFLYWTQFVVGIPHIQNSGAEGGTIAHNLLELLAKEENRSIYDLILKNDSIYAHKPIKKLVLRYISKSQTLKNNTETLDKVDFMVKTGLRTDFFIEGGQIISNEYKFQINNKNPYYKLKGFFDKVAIKDDYTLIRDFKGSRLQFAGKDRETNIQALCYTLAARKLWPERKARLEFVFLLHPENAIMPCEFTDEVLGGFEQYLEAQQKRIDNFTYSL